MGSRWSESVWGDGKLDWIVTLLYSIFHRDIRSNSELNTFAACWGNGHLDTRWGVGGGGEGEKVGPHLM